MIRERGCTIELTSRTGNARFVRSGLWRFRAEEAPKGSRVFSELELKLSARYFFLAPVLLLTGKRAIRRDLESLKRVIENGGD